MIVPFVYDPSYVSPPIRDMNEGSVETIDFNALQPINSATAELVDKWTGERTPLLANPANVTHALVVVTGQKRGSSYDVIVTFNCASGRVYSRKLYVPVRA